MKYALLLFIFFAFTPAGEMERTALEIKKGVKTVPIFVYHRFGDNRFPATNISDNNFEAHLKYLQREGYQTLTFSETAAYLKSRGKAEKVVCLTVDDGFKSFLANGVPLLKKYGFTATVFVNTATVGSPDYLSWDELKTIQSSGVEIGNHSDSHAYFLNKTGDTERLAFKDDLIKSQSMIEQKLGFIPKVFAYPYGEFDEAMKLQLISQGFTAAAAQTSGVSNTKGDFYAMPRFPMSDRYAKIGSFIEKIGMLPIDVNEVETIDSGYSGSPDNPRIIFHFNEANLKMERVQCFVQGKRCSKSVRIKKAGEIEMSVKSKTPLIGRRSLYTITVPDTDGKWHWYSYTWVIPTVSE